MSLTGGSQGDLVVEPPTCSNRVLEGVLTARGCVWTPDCSWLLLTAYGWSRPTARDGVWALLGALGRSPLSLDSPESAQPLLDGG